MLILLTRSFLPRFSLCPLNDPSHPSGVGFLDELFPSAFFMHSFFFVLRT